MVSADTNVFTFAKTYAMPSPKVPYKFPVILLFTDPIHISVLSMINVNSITNDQPND